MSMAADLAGSKCPTADRLTTSTPLPNLTRHRSRQKRRGRVPEVVRTDRGASVAAPAFAAGLSGGCAASVELRGDWIEATTMIMELRARPIVYPMAVSSCRTVLGL